MQAVPVPRPVRASAWGHAEALTPPALGFPHSQAAGRKEMIVFFPGFSFPLEGVTQLDNQTNRKIWP